MVGASVLFLQKLRVEVLVLGPYTGSGSLGAGQGREPSQGTNSRHRDDKPRGVACAELVFYGDLKFPSGTVGVPWHEPETARGTIHPHLRAVAVTELLERHENRELETQFS